MQKITAKQARFVEEYLLDANVREAARRAGYNQMVGYRLMRRPEVAEAIARDQDARAARMQVSADRVIAELAAIAFSDISRVVSWGDPDLVPGADGEADEAATPGRAPGYRLRRSETLAPETVAAISEFHRYSHGALRLRMHDKLPALLLLGRHMGLFGPGAVTKAQLRQQEREAEQETRRRRLAELPREKRLALRALLRGE
jgi:phage terminase small subunit